MNSDDEQTSSSSQFLAKYIAMVVRNAMEDFHGDHLSDAQMKELNPVIRNAIFTALHAFEHYDDSSAVRQFVDFNIRMIPVYWEEPQLLESYTELQQF